MNYTFFEDDKLNRKPFAEFLLSLIEKNELYRRPDSSKSYSIAINAVYGAGKTRFLKMFKSLVAERKQYSVLYYSAWEHDLYDDPLIPILSLLDNQRIFDEHNEENSNKVFGKKALRILKRMGTSFVSMKAKKFFGDEYDEIVDDIKELVNNEDGDSDTHELRMKCIVELQNGLKSVTKNKPLIFIIDELDRCKPTFAINTLEVAKHLLDVENLIFIFALDMLQIKEVIRKCYGTKIDADGYLCKIFDYITLLPAVNIQEYVRISFDQIDTDIQTKFSNFISFAIDILNYNHCSLRIIDSILVSFSIMWVTFLKQYSSERANILYFFSLFLKFVYTEDFQRISQVMILDSENKKRLADIGRNNEVIRNYLDIYSQEIGKSTKKLFINGQKIDFDLFTIKDTNKIAIGNSCHKVEYDIFPEGSVNGVLFLRDLKNISEIESLTYGQYIHGQLEMFNPLPVD